MKVAARTISRRTVLRGCGAAMALPLLESMQALAASNAPNGPKRAAFFYIPNGVVQSVWHPKESGKGFALSPTLQPLVAVRKKISVFTNLDRIKVAGTDGHAQASTCWISSARPDELSPAGYPLKRTLDQVIADHTGQHTPFRSLELSCNNYQDNKESVYFDNISWYGHGHVAQSMRDPRKVFNRVFRIQEQQAIKSVLDLVRDDASSLRRDLGQLDRRKLDEYLDSVRTVERQIGRVEAKHEQLAKLKLESPHRHWTEMRRDEHIQIMGDLMILALQTDMTRVASLMVSPERWGTPQMIHGVFEKPIVHHSMTHAQGDSNVRNDLAKLDRYHVKQFAELVQKMDKIKEGERSLLDNTLFTLGSGLSSGKTHVCSDLPTIIAGNAGGAFEANTHYRAKEGTPIANLWLSIARIMGVRLDHFGDSSGTVV